GLYCFGAVTCFFFQAEDGIRVATVTGVQTCALPISLPRADPARARRLPRRAGCADDQATGAHARGGAWDSLRGGRSRRAARRARSEERRVGKGCGVGLKAWGLLART